jgi:hypothetical protein
MSTRTFDADLTDPLAAHRIAVTSSHPSHCFLVAFDRESEARPDERETAMLVSFLTEYKDHWYGQNGFRQQMERQPFDTDGGANGVVFHKYGPNDWGYRRMSFTQGPIFVPVHPRIRESHGGGVGLLDLSSLMDRISGHGDEPSPWWLEWKAAHPEVFA